MTARTAAERRLVDGGYGAWWGAFEGDRLLASMGLFTASEGLARFQNVKTHPDARGRGLAGTLVHRVSRYGFEELGARTLVMVADPDYLAIRDLPLGRVRRHRAPAAGRAEAADRLIGVDESGQGLSGEAQICLPPLQDAIAASGAVCPSP